MSTAAPSELPPEDRFYAVRPRKGSFFTVMKRHQSLQAAVKKADILCKATGDKVFIMEVIGAIVPDAKPD